MTTTHATMTTDPGFPASVEVVRRTVSSAARLGQVVRRQTQSSVSRNTSRREVRRWQLSYNLVLPDELTDIVGAFDAAGGSGLPIEITPPDVGATVPVRFLSNTLDVAVRGNIHVLRIQFEEVI